MKDLKKATYFTAVIVLTLLLARVTLSLGQDQARYGGTLIIAEDEGPEIFNNNYATNDYEPLYMIYSRLVQEGMTSAEIVPDLAHSWEVSEDLKTWTFHMYSNVTFHDGVACTSADVKWTYESVLNEKGPWATQISHIDKIETPNSSTVVFKLNKPDAVFTRKLVALNAPNILPKHLYENTNVRENPYNYKPVGTGPFKWSAQSTDAYTILLKNDKYFLSDIPYLDRIIVRYIPERATAMAAMEIGEIHSSYPPISAADALRLRGNPNIRIFTPFVDSCWHIDFNMTVPPFNDVRVRRAVAYAINTTDMNYRMYFGKAAPMRTAFFTKPTWVPSTDPEAQLPNCDPAKAEELLDEAGYPRGQGGVRLTCNFWSWTNQEQMDNSELIREYLKQVGIELNVIYLDSPTHNSKIIQRHDFDGIDISGGFTGWDPDGMKLFVGTGGPRNVMEYSNSRVDELFNLGVSVADPEERKVYYDEIQEILAQELPRIPLIHYTRFFAQRTEYSGYYWEPEAGKVQGNKQVHLVQWAYGELPPEPPTPVDNSTILALSAATQALNAMVNTLGGTVDALQGTIENLNSQLVMSTNIAYAAVAISVAAVVATIAIVIKRKK